MDEKRDRISVRLRQDIKTPKNFQLELAGTASADRVGRKLHRWDAVKMHEIHHGVEVAAYVYMTGGAAKQRLAESQMELYAES